ncbi:MAG: hypothetical protein K2X93_27220 [Candidatus Obscuribacterales bacterium]|nr:hypothetical protein [Candidatus Obscuribacterales bacterium]
MTGKKTGKMIPISPQKSASAEALERRLADAEEVLRAHLGLPEWKRPPLEVDEKALSAITGDKVAQLRAQRHLGTGIYHFSKRGRRVFYDWRAAVRALTEQSTAGNAGGT